MCGCWVGGPQDHVLFYRCRVLYVKAGLHARRKHKHKHMHKHKPRVNQDDASTSASYFSLCWYLRRPGSHVAYVRACAYAYACLEANYPLRHDRNVVGTQHSRIAQHKKILTSFKIIILLFFSQQITRNALSRAPARLSLAPSGSRSNSGD